MHKTPTLILCIFVTFTAISQNVFTKYENMQDVSSMVMDSNMFRLLSQIDFNSTDPETKAYLELIENIENIKVFSTKKGAIQQRMKADIKTYLQNTTLEQLLTTEENDQHVALYAKSSKVHNHVSELLIFIKSTAIADDQNTMLVSITGTIDLNQVFKLAKDLNISGSNTLKRIGN